MANLNKVILLGNLTRNPELRYTPSGTPVATFRLATSQRVRQRDEWIDEVCYVDIITYGRLAEKLAAWRTAKFFEERAARTDPAAWIVSWPALETSRRVRATKFRRTERKK